MHKKQFLSCFSLFSSSIWTVQVVVPRTPLATAGDVFGIDFSFFSCLSSASATDGETNCSTNILLNSQKAVQFAFWGFIF
jgi:hypothetical protein